MSDNITLIISTEEIENLINGNWENMKGGNLSVDFPHCSKNKMMKFFEKLQDGIKIVQHDSEKHKEYIYTTKNNNLEIIIDYEEYEREATTEEIENFEAKTTKEDVLNYFINYDHNSYIHSKEPRRIWEMNYNAMFKFFSVINSAGTFLPDTGQYQFEIKCYKNKSLEEHMEEINMLVPHIKPVLIKEIDDERPFKILDIFEQTLSEHGVYQLLIYEDKVVVGIMRYSSWNEIEKFSNLEDAVDYVRKNIYYEEDEIKYD